MLLERKLTQERVEALLKEQEDALRQQEIDRLANRNLLNSLYAQESSKQVQQNKRVATVEEEINQLKQRMSAFDKGTLGQSMDLIVPPFSTDTNPITLIFEVLFFLKPIKLLKLLQARPDVVKWSQLPRY